MLTSLEPLNDKTGGPDERKAVDSRQGADFIKISRRRASARAAPRRERRPIEAACGEARAGPAYARHAHSPESMRAAALAGCTQVGTGFATGEVLKLMAERGTYFDAVPPRLPSY